MAVDTHDEAARTGEEQRLRDLLAAVRAVRASTESPMVDTNLRSVEEVLVHSLVMFTDDLELHPYMGLLAAP
ncbi:MAG TPA: hypothetical protein VFA94_10640 [Acidimicrobiales bacterium]|nr:hypothetical protein [Acidimicrobiales bacterium]